MALPEVATHAEWLVARTRLLEQEKELTRRRDALNAERRRMPMVRIDKVYVFEGPDGPVGLLDLFEGRRQLIVGHFMFDPRWEDGCPSCSAGADEVSTGLLEHLHTRDTTLAYVSRAPLAKIERYKARKGWTFPWYSSYGSDFNYDFHVTLDDSVTPFEYNFRTAEEYRRLGQGGFVDGDQPFEMPGTSFFLRDGDTRLPHQLDVRAGRRDDRRLVLLPRSHGTRPPGGLGGAEGSCRPRARRDAELQQLTLRLAPATS